LSFRRIANLKGSGDASHGHIALHFLRRIPGYLGQEGIQFGFTLSVCLKTKCGQAQSFLKKAVILKGDDGQTFSGAICTKDAQACVTAPAGCRDEPDR
jgi:hypothetical protein